MQQNYFISVAKFYFHSFYDSDGDGMGAKNCRNILDMTPVSEKVK
jgi:hypothetical protein